jgi:hypothetical protein
VIAYVGKTSTGEYKPFYYGDVLSENDIEISEDMYIIKGEDADKYKEPPTLTTIIIKPEQVRMKPGDKQAFVADGYDQFGRLIELPELAWTITGGVMDSQGVYTAGNDQGSFIVKVSAAKVYSTANVVIYIPVQRKPDGGHPDLDEDNPPVEPTKLSKLAWNGDLPPQKWMNFYSKVLARFASTPGLKINVSIEVEPDSGILEQKAEEARTALRELGLDDKIELE